MNYKFFSYNGEVLPVDEAVVPLSNLEYSYGFGVYETIRVVGGKVNFVSEHCQRLIESAKLIGLEHQFSVKFLQKSLADLVAQNQAENCNLKVLLIGGKSPEAANLYIICLNPLFPDRKLFKTGAASITYEYEREFPGAKTLSMLSSYLAYREARRAGAYDALLVNRDGCITEGTRTNFLALQGRTIISPKSSQMLPGVTRAHVLEVATRNGFEVIEQDINPSELSNYDGACLTSTVCKIMPLKSIDDHVWEELPPALLELMAAFDQFLAD